MLPRINLVLSVTDDAVPYKVFCSRNQKGSVPLKTPVPRTFSVLRRREGRNMDICFVAPRFPFPIIKGDTLRAYHQIRELSRDHRIHLIAAVEAPVSDAALLEMRKYCAAIEVVHTSRLRSYASLATLGFASRLPLQVLYFDSPQLRAAVRRVTSRGRFDVVHAMTIRVAPSVFAGSNVPIVVDFMDSFAANIQTRREVVGPVMRRFYDLEYARVASYERSVAARTAGGFVIADLDRDAIQEPRLAIIPNGVDTQAVPFSDVGREAATLLFTGNMGYQPNIDAVVWFTGACWAKLRERHPALRLVIAGARPAPAVVALGRMPGVEVTGKVDSMLPYLHRATVAICPIRCGSGMQNKVLEAMAAGVPVVTSSFANRSIGASDLEAEIVDTESQVFANAVSRLLNDANLRGRRALAARRFVESEYSWSQRAAQLVTLYESAIAYQARSRLLNAG